MPVLFESPRQSAMPQTGGFSGHETFPFRYAWLKKGVDALLLQPDIFNREDAIVTLGVGKNMVRSIRHWCLAAQIIEEGEVSAATRTRPLSLTPIGRNIFVEPAWDPYIEDDNTLWLLHWLLTSNAKKATTWFWAFNLLKDQDFTRSSFSSALSHVCEEHGYKVSASTVSNDASCFLRTYAVAKRGPASTAEETLDCPLASLGLLADLGDNRLRFNIGLKTGLSDELFVYCLLDFWDSYHPSQETISMREITYGVGSPGKIFKLDDDAVLRYLDRVDTVTIGRLRFNDTAILRQVVRHDAVHKEEILGAYYAR